MMTNEKLNSEELIDLVLTNIMENENVEQIQVIDNCSRFPRDSYQEIGVGENNNIKVSIFSNDGKLLSEEEYGENKFYDPDMEFVTLEGKRYIRPTITLLHKYVGETVNTELCELKQNDYIILLLSDNLNVIVDIIKNNDNKEVKELFKLSEDHLVLIPRDIMMEFIGKMFSKGNKIEPYFLLNDYIKISDGYKKYMELNVNNEKEMHSMLENVSTIVKDDTETHEHKCNCGHHHEDETPLFKEINGQISLLFDILIKSDKELAKKLINSLISKL